MKKIMMKARVNNLKPNEQAAVKYFITELKTAKGKDSAITNGYLVDRWNKQNPNKPLNDPGGRKVIRHIRDTGLIKKLMADHYGYFIANDREMYEGYLSMLRRRAKRLAFTYTALRGQYKRIVR